MAKQKVDTPRDGKAWADTVNTQPLPPTMYHKLTLEGIRDVQRGFSYNSKGEKVAPPEVCYNDPIGDILRDRAEVDRHNALESAVARMNNRPFEPKKYDR